MVRKIKVAAKRHNIPKSKMFILFLKRYPYETQRTTNLEQSKKYRSKAKEANRMYYNTKTSMDLKWDFMFNAMMIMATESTSWNIWKIRQVLLVRNDVRMYLSCYLHMFFIIIIIYLLLTLPECPSNTLRITTRVPTFLTKEKRVMGNSYHHLYSINIKQ